MLIVVYLGFVSLGVPDALYGIAWPGLRDSFALSEAPFGLPLLATMAGFLLSSTLVGMLVRHLGLGPLLALSTALVAMGLIGFAAAPSFSFFITCAVLIGLGSGAIDAGLNTYAAERYSGRQMNWLHAAFGLGAAISPFVMTLALVTASWRVGYGAVAAGMVALALLFTLSRHAFRAHAEPTPSEHAYDPVPSNKKLAGTQIAFFALYAGTETAFGQWCFTILSETKGYGIEASGFWAGGFWFALFLGRVVLGAFSDRLGADRVVLGGLLAVVLGACLFAFGPVSLAPIGLLVAGLALAPVFPLLMHRTPRLFGAGAARMIGLQVGAAMIGGVTVLNRAGFAGGSNS